MKKGKTSDIMLFAKTKKLVQIDNGLEFVNDPDKTSKKSRFVLHLGHLNDTIWIYKADVLGENSHEDFEERCVDMV